MENHFIGQLFCTAEKNEIGVKLRIAPAIRML